jgi:hypothetical protein
MATTSSVFNHIGEDPINVNSFAEKRKEEEANYGWNYSDDETSWSNSDDDKTGGIARPIQKKQDLFRICWTHKNVTNEHDYTLMSYKDARCKVNYLNSKSGDNIFYWMLHKDEKLPKN